MNDLKNTKAPVSTWSF